jgi:hypothetical protein
MKRRTTDAKTVRSVTTEIENDTRLLTKIAPVETETGKRPSKRNTAATSMETVVFLSSFSSAQPVDKNGKSSTHESWWSREHDHYHVHAGAGAHVHPHPEDDRHVYRDGQPDDRYFHPDANRWGRDGPPVCSLELLLEWSVEEARKQKRYAEEQAALAALESEYEQGLI